MRLNVLAALLLAANAGAADKSGKIPTVTLPSLTVPALGPALPRAADHMALERLRSMAPTGRLPLDFPASQAAAPHAAARHQEQAAMPGMLGAKAVAFAAKVSAGQPAAAPRPEAASDRLVQARGEELRAAFSDPKSLAEVTTEPEAGKAYGASPEDWRDEILYSVMLDRFAKGPNAKPVGDPKSGLTRHGGDLRGVIERLDYIKRSGVTTLLLSPVTETVPEAYHGYAPVHFMRVDPHLGTMGDLKELVAEAHARGLKVVLDIVVNHTGPVFEYEGGPAASGWAAVDQPKKNIGYWTSALKPVELTNPDRFTRRGVIHDWNDKDQSQLGDFPPNYRHLSTEDPGTQADLIKLASWWIKETDVDGFRLDAIRHVDQGFLARFNAEIKDYAASLGKKNFLMLGENSTGLDADLTDGFGKGLNALYNYPEFRRVLWALHGKAPARQLEDSLTKSVQALGEQAGKLVRFIDLHDTYRFLRGGEDPRLLKAAFAWLLFSLGIPLVYYGTEQAFRTSHSVLEPENGKLPADPENRADMFDSFDQSSDMYGFLSKLAGLRAKYPALRRGYQHYRWTDLWGPGISAYSRLHEGHEVLVATNTAEQPRAATMHVDARHSPEGSVFFDELDPSYEVRAFKPGEGGSQISIELPPRGVRVMVRR